MQLTWKASESASAWHAIHTLACGHAIVAPQLAESLVPLLDSPPVASPDDLIPLLAMLSQQAAAGVEENRALAEATIVKLWGRQAASPAQVSVLAAWASSVERAYFDWHAARNRQSNPQSINSEIVTRTTPLRQEWETRGPGMMLELARLTEPLLVAESAEVVMVLPAAGGHGVAHLASNRITIEAMLANADDTLPEVVRLAWLLAQLQFDLPRIAEVLPVGNVERVAKLAMLIPVLSVAGEVGLVEPVSPEFVARALVAFRVASSLEESVSMSKIVQDWWETYVQNRVAWPVAVAALDRLLP